ncbi:MAG: MarC family protein [Hyphomicrobiales bacterium]|nr:MarC family protein [Hyphomicrobiales bacterium]MCP5373378.1 MarC family protein [Hyphomicrobiales bacterium]
MTAVTFAVTLFLLMDPLGNIPVFLGVLQSAPANRRKRIVMREMVIALVILLAFLFFGKFIMGSMGISGPALNIAGGVILFLMAIRMIFPGNRLEHAEEDEQDPFIVPLAVPLVAGPSAMALVVLMATQQPGRIWEWTLGLVCAWAVTAVVLVLADNLRALLKQRGLRAVARLMGMILTTLAVQMLLNGIAGFLTEKGLAAG